MIEFIWRDMLLGLSDVSSNYNKEYKRNNVYNNIAPSGRWGGNVNTTKKKWGTDILDAEMYTHTHRDKSSVIP